MTLGFVHDSKIPKIMHIRKERQLNAQKTPGDLTADEGDESDDEALYVEKDPVRKMQFDHNISTCLTISFLKC